MATSDGRQIGFAGETKVILPNGITVQIKDLEDRLPPKFPSYDLVTHEAILDQSIDVNLCSVNDESVRIKFSTGQSITCGVDQEFLLEDGTYRAANKLRGGGIQSLFQMIDKETTKPVTVYTVSKQHQRVPLYCVLLQSNDNVSIDVTRTLVDPFAIGYEQPVPLAKATPGSLSIFVKSRSFNLPRES